MTDVRGQQKVKSSQIRFHPPIRVVDYDRRAELDIRQLGAAMRNARARITITAVTGALAAAMASATTRRESPRSARRNDRMLPIEWF